MAKTDAQRRAEADARKRDAGLTRVSVWVPRDKAAEVHRLAEGLRASYKA